MVFITKYTLNCADPTHQRAHGNKLYFEQALADAAAEDQQEETTSQEEEEEGSVEFNKDEIVNPRQYDGYRASEEFMTYERLCRGEDAIVSLWLIT